MDKPSSGASAARSSFSLSPEHLKVNQDDPSARLGQGGFGVVFKGSYRLAPAAIKQLLVQDDLPPEKLAEFFQEAEIMASLHHPNIIQLYGYTSVKPYRIVMELMPKGSLFKVLHQSEQLSWAQRILWGIEIGAGLHYLHTSQPIILHRDLKSLNVLISKDNQAKLTDFGLALSNLRSTTKTVTATSKKPEGTVGSLRWMAPELFSLKPKYSAASDLFAYAMVLWELASREIPYAEVGDDSIIKDSIRGGERADIPGDCPRVLATLIQACWDQKPEQRLTAEKAVERLQAALPEFDAKYTQQSLEGLSFKDKRAVESRGYAISRDYTTTTDDPAKSRGYALTSELTTSVAKVAAPIPPKVMATAPKAEAAAATAFFAAPAKPAVKQADVEKLLLHVARGEQDEAQALLKIKGNEALLLQKGKVTDYSNRTFKNITAFQYALWALDWHMWKMLLNHLPKEEAAQQLQELETNATEHSQHYDFTPLIQALRNYEHVENRTQGTTSTKKHWCTFVGGAQAQVPAHVANEYCRNDRSFKPTPSFKEETLPRTLKLEDDSKFFPFEQYSFQDGSINYLGVHRCDLKAPRLGQGGWPAHCLSIPDLKAISGLCEVRAGQYQELKRELTTQLAARPR